ncbi:hypothetical protein [Halovivax limisalsi]|uniref:hypothetical protein n=1 Tax=Halovivax limisalsi TaxID=1453760 RepID=UPI001FFC65C7|nr:hypothetical protein [Halovivax limisalsi]
MKRLLLIVLLASMMLLSAGCIGLGDGSDSGPENPTETESPEKTVDPLSEGALLDAIDSVERYEYDLTFRYEVDSARNLSISAAGAVDRAANSYRSEQEYDLFGTVQSSTYYVVDETMYATGDAFDSADGWVRQPVTESDSDIVRQKLANLSAHTTLIENGTYGQFGTETVDGVETTEMVASLSENQTDAVAEFVMDDPANLEDVSYSIYVNESTSFVHKIELNTSAAVDEVRTTTSVEIKFANHNGDIDVTLPEAARSATPVDDTEADS